MDKKTAQFKTVEKLLYKQAWKYARAYGVDFEDVKSEAFVIFCEVLEKYNPVKGSFCNYLFHRLRNLQDVCTRERKKTGYVELTERVPAPETFLDIRIDFQQELDELSDPATKMLHDLINDKFTPTSERNRSVNVHRVRQKYVKEGWTTREVNETWHELEDAYRRA